MGISQGASQRKPPIRGVSVQLIRSSSSLQVSFPEHVKLAKEHDGAKRWGWRYLGVGSWEGRIANPEDLQRTLGAAQSTKKSLEKTHGIDDGGVRGDAHRKKTGLPDDLNWVREDLTKSYSPMAKEGDTAQVHPALFTRSMLELAQERGAKLVLGRALSIERAGGAVSGVTYTPHDGGEPVTLPATHVVLCAGAWSPSLVPTLPIHGTRAHSITIRTAPAVTIAPYALFTEIALPGGGRVVTPEIYARPDGELYACGTGDDYPLPQTVDDVPCDADACESIHTQVGGISKELHEGEVTTRQACFLPIVSTGGGPIIGEAAKVARNLVIATGHTCWVCISRRARC
jgi:glycerol-3-phosphate dehydrogenase